MLVTCQLSASFCYHAEFQEVCYQKQENGRFVARSRHGMCESGFNTAGERHGDDMVCVNPPVGMCVSTVWSGTCLETLTDYKV